VPRELNIHSVRGRLPVRYRVNPLIRFSSVAIQILISSYCLFVLFKYAPMQVSAWFRILPLVILFISLDTLIKHLTTLNELIFGEEFLMLRFILLPGKTIVYEKIVSMELRKVITYYVFLTWTDGSGKKRTLKTQASFPRMLEIMFNIADLAPQTTLNPELEKMIDLIRRMRENKEQTQTKTEA
jgi:hypothetical protein